MVDEDWASVATTLRRPGRAMSFVAIPGLIRPMLGPIAGGLIVGYLQWRFIFFVNLPIGIAGLVLVYLHLPDYREQSPKPLDIVGLMLFGSSVALLSYVLEIFGDHTLGLGEILGLLALSLTLIVGYGLHATQTAFPLLQLSLFRIRTFSAAVSGSFFTRLGIGDDQSSPRCSASLRGFSKRRAVTAP
ncbi:MAG TPA: MFS transporter [Methylovirgula sp.]|nr:MFS transporter [Methylovirgula sp.]